MAMLSGVSVSTGARSVVSRYVASGTEPLETALERAKGRSERSSWSARDSSAVDWFLMPSVIRRRGEGGLDFGGPGAALGGLDGAVGPAVGSAAIVPTKKKEEW